MKNLHNIYYSLLNTQCKDIHFLELPKSTQQHLKALRLNDHENIILFNGVDFIAQYSFDQANKEFKFIKSIEPNKKKSTKLSLYLSPPNGPDFMLSIKQACEIGVQKIHLFRSQNCQWPQRKEFPIEKINKIIVGSCEQCTRYVLPTVKIENNNILSKLDTLRTLDKQQIWIADESLSPTKAIGLNNPTQKTAQQNFFIGPEGGWTHQETQFFKTTEKLSLGPFILKVPTAIVSAATLIRKSIEI